MVETTRCWKSNRAKSRILNRKTEGLNFIVADVLRPRNVVRPFIGLNDRGKEKLGSFDEIVFAVEAKKCRKLLTVRFVRVDARDNY